VESGRRTLRAGDRPGTRRVGALVLALAAAGSFGACRRAAPVAERKAADPDLVAQSPATADASGYPFRPGERRAVEEFLKANRDLRLAVDSDRRSSESDDDLPKLYGVYHPYFLRGDINDDGILDFVLAFVRRDSDRDAPWFSIVVFNGTEGSGFSAGTFLERDVSLADGDLSVDRDSIVITPNLDDEDSTRRYRWDPLRRSYVFVRDAADDDDGAASSQT